MSEKSLKNKAIKIQGKDYVLVADRILYFNEQYPNGSIVTEELENEQRVEFKATVYPDMDKPERRFTGHSQAVWGEGMVNKTAATENAETSAVGRALAMMGIGVLESVASADEMVKAQHSPATGKFATAKQIDWIRKEAQRVTGLENAEDLDQWVKDNIGAEPAKLGIRSVKLAADRIRSIGEKLQGEERATMLASETAAETVEVTDQDLADLAAGKLPY